ncbi:hypothetical protein HYALB_00011416 [Hymenoscyphus albidus]|uniref:Serine hydrolase domain-containing protein n=1 Tax=Hymenoscyphus albidus TaxID=595503 RepID=A0A9N9LH88_9HELO|nr:hypothetical protein HYALB_00011416 [Hymenoscyphus albidus]
MIFLPSYLKLGLTAGEPLGTPLPVILCLHGGGSNATVFNIQSLRIQRLLSNTFTFVFLDGPSVTSAGAGVIPTFQGCDPYFRWFKGDRDINIMPSETRSQVSRALTFINSEPELGSVVAFLGFSQGGKLGAGLLWEQMLKGTESGWDFKFGIICNAISPPMTEIRGEDEGKRVQIPTLHVVGLEDEWRESSRSLFGGFFDGARSKKMEFGVGHRLPTAENETKDVADEILRIWGEIKEGA